MVWFTSLVPFTYKNGKKNTYLENNALASANLILQPPENVLVALACISGVKPKPLSIMDALAGALSASMFSSCAYTSLSSVDRFVSVDLKYIIRIIYMFIVYITIFVLKLLTS